MFFFSAGGLSPTKEKRAKSAKIYRFEAGSDYSCHLISAGLDPQELADMGYFERRKALEEAGLNPDDYDFND